MKLVPEELYALDTTILVHEELYALNTIVLVPEELIMYLWVESIFHDSLEGKLLEYMYESYWMEFHSYNLPLKVKLIIWHYNHKLSMMN